MTASLAGLPLKLRIDRVDQLLPDNLVLLLDYKTGRSTLQQWMGDRLESPQLPLYATLMPVDGVAFADLSGRGEGLHGLIRETLPHLSEWLEHLPGMIPPEKIKHSTQTLKFQSFDQVISAWRYSLEKLAEAFMAGEVAVDPLETACRYCGLERLCRVV
jgi:ATP-dependent helicase/DNAse subunit B